MKDMPALQSGAGGPGRGTTVQGRAACEVWLHGSSGPACGCAEAAGRLLGFKREPSTAVGGPIGGCE